MPRTSLADILVGTTSLTPEQLQRAEELSTQRGVPLEEVLVQQRFLGEDELLQAQGQQLGMPYWKELPEKEFDVSLMMQVPLPFARQHKLVPIRKHDGVVLVAMSQALSLQPLDDVSALLKAPVEPVLSPEREVLGALNRLYDTGSQSAAKVIQDLDAQTLGRLAHDLEGPQDILDHDAEAPIIQLVNLILSQAVRDRASDIHIEPFERSLKVRYRIDGVLHEVLSPPKALQPRITSRLKVMADLNIAETRLPQDGRIAIRVRNREIDIRVSVVPTAFGERLVLRLLDKSGAMLSLEEIGFAEDMLTLYHRLIHRSHGIILVTGPTGSGKTTTLYATLQLLNSAELNIITVEDPIEYQLGGVGQIQVNPKIELTFANGLRSILRQDPDIIMVGEIRDRETAEIAIQASLTGHLVFSTLHTNDAPSAVTRLIDMGVEPFLISSSVLAMMAQRLVRLICPNCREPFEPDPETLSELGLTPEDLTRHGGQFFHGRGCETCRHTGYRGRTAIYELLVLDDPVRNLIMQRANANMIKTTAVQRSMQTLLQNGARKVLAGRTTAEEVLRVTQESE
ncbi:MAG: type II secretion system protein GspE [Candidatus Tectomicrobia bacterium]|uniref:protein-secreting ATPase n=1 Tax=Tectimicrobiota bacterium TaxID=2528274 RepID=A0A937W088_UNCTE|nr:type II secretion system protein GspE [Candidatus Tectomicrobia bacterium]